MRRLPPLNALRAFETVARAGTLTRAAEELLVTPTAVGRHVKNLEDILGTPLFEREGGTLALTPHGRHYARSLSRAFELMNEATDLLVDRKSRTPLTLRAYTTFLVRWLIPQLPDFRRAHPDVELRLTTAFDAVDFERDDVDLGVRYGNGRWPGLEVTPLFDDELVAVGNGEMRDRFASLPPEEAFASSTLLVHTLRLDDWPDWLEAAGLGDVIPARQLPLDDMALIYQGALDGMGVGLSQRRYLTQDLADGKLHLLSPVVLRRQRGFHLVCLPETARNPAVQAFTNWITARIESGG
ncbi:MAG TPA: LysR substrate-binding domain-containing protein [Burkholderiaceae bacterium]|jgi:LysR family glycine cleavage system transcriptional activator